MFNPRNDKETPPEARFSPSFRVSKIPKRNGEYRTVYALDWESKRHLLRHLPYLAKRLNTLDDEKANYAFVKGRNCVQHALQHIGYQFTLSFDLEDFFDTVTKKHLSGVLEDEVLDDCLIEGAPRQGMPTSPLIATIAFLPCDRKIRRALEQQLIDSTYTRYADDRSRPTYAG